MSELRISEIPTLDVYNLRKILLTNALTDTQKVNFIRKNNMEIKSVLRQTLSSEDFNLVMYQRPLLRFRPMRNIAMCKGDKILLAKSLGVPPNELKLYIDETVNTLKSGQNWNKLPEDKMKSIKTYIYRHGSNDQLALFYDYELEMSKNLPKTLNKTLSFNNGGVADYFTRPIHRMSDKTLLNLYGITNKHLEKAQNNGTISEQELIASSIWSLNQLCLMQDNSRLIRKNSEYKVEKI